ncbi:hypothetical protein AB1N83_005909 [Pleurotus pulmonarius]
MTSPSLHTVFREHARSSPDNTFLVEDQDAVLTYQQAFVLVTKLIAPRIRTLHHSAAGASDGAKVVIIAHNSSLSLLALFAIWELRLSVVPLSTTADPFLWAGMIELIKPSFILCAPTLVASVQNAILSTTQNRNAMSPIIDIALLIPPQYTSPRGNTSRASDYIKPCIRWLREYNTVTPYNSLCVPQLDSRDVDPKAVAVTLFTSSAVDWSTLKCVSYTHEILYYSAERTSIMLGGAKYTASPKTHIGWLPLSHCFELAVFSTVVLRTAGAYIFFDPSISSPRAESSATTPSLFLDALAYHSPVTSISMLPSMFEEITRTCSQDHMELLRGLHSMPVSGAPTLEDVFQWAASAEIPYFDCSGATEMAGPILMRHVWDPSQRDTGLQVLPGLMGFLKKVRQTDLHGELVIKGMYLPKGYVSRQSTSLLYDETTGVTTYFTGDIYSHKEGSPVLCYLQDEEIPPYNLVHAPLTGLSYVGRLDDIIILSSGLKVDAPPLEKIITAIPGIQCSAILANKSGDALVALVLPSPSAMSLKMDEIISSVQRVNESLPLTKRLHRGNIVIVEELPKTTKGVVNKKLLRKAIAQARRDSDVHELFGGYKDRGWLNSNGVSEESSPSETPDMSDILGRVVKVLSHTLSLPATHFEPKDSLADLALTSLLSTMLARALQTEFDVPITAARLYGLHSVEDIGQFIAAALRVSTVPSPSFADSPTPIGIDSTVSATESIVVISGASCRFTGGIDNLDSFWSSLLAPEVFLRSCSQRRPESRWPKNHPQEAQMHPSYWLDDEMLNNTHSFSNFFKLTPRDVRAMSPNARLVLQLGYEAIQDAGIAPQSLRGKNWGVFTSVNESGWRLREYSDTKLQDYSLRAYGSADDAVGARLSYFLDLTGPAIEIKTACSSSGVALHQARLALKNGDCDAAIVIAATTHFHPAGAIFRAGHGLVSPSGKSNPFSELADGFVASEGAAAVVLQKSNHVKVDPYAILRTTGVGQDGASHGFFAPNLEAQKRLFRRTLANAGLKPQDVSLIEAHGTGTQLGDAIELQAISDVFDEGRDSLLYVGSAKAVLGHTEECAGLVGVLKAMLCLSHSIVTPQPVIGTLIQTPSTSTPSIVVPSRITQFSPTSDHILASVSSFGLSGTLANIILQSTPLSSAVPVQRNRHLFLISAFSASDFKASVARYIQFFQGKYLSDSLLEDSCRTTQIGRDHFAVRRAWEVDGWNTLLSHLREVISKPALIPAPINIHPRVGVWFAIPGDCQSNRHPHFLEKMATLSGARWQISYDRVKEQLALAQSLSTFGIHPSIVGGEGAMELAAAIFAGIIPSDAAFRFVKPDHHGSAIVVEGDALLVDEQLACWRHDELALLGRRGGSVCVLQGVAEALSSLESVNGITSQARLPPPTVISPNLTCSLPKVNMVSAHLGEVLNGETATSPNYWHGVQDRPFNSVMGLKAMLVECDYVLHLGLPPGAEGEERIVSTHGDSLEGILGAFFERGCNIDWSVFTLNGRRARLPAYSLARDE